MESISTLRDILTTAPIDVAVGAVIIIVYMGMHLYKRQQDRVNLSNILSVFASGFSLLPGLSVLLASFQTQTPARGVEQSYFFLGGFAVIYVGVQELRKKFKEI